MKNTGNDLDKKIADENSALLELTNKEAVKPVIARREKEARNKIARKDEARKSNRGNRGGNLGMK